MKNLFHNKYRIESARLQNWDYRWNAAYFITITAYKHQHFFGKIENKKMVLNKTGKIVSNYIDQIPKYNQNVFIDMSVVMPNHIHFVLGLYNPKYGISLDFDSKSQAVPLYPFKTGVFVLKFSKV